MKLSKNRRPRPPKVDRRTAWKRVAARTGGSFVAGKRPSADRVETREGPWRIQLDTYVVSTGTATVTYTRARAYVVGWRGLRVTVRMRGLFDRLWERLGYASPLPLGRALLERFVVKGKPRARVPSLFSSGGLTSAIVALPSLRLEVKPAARKMRRKLGEDAAEVACRTTGVITDVERLVGMVGVVRETVLALHRVGEARDEEVPVP